MKVNATTIPRPFFAILLLLALLNACMRPTINERLAADFKTDGFLSPDHFQIIINGMPDSKSRGLVERRESAMKNAEARLRDTVIERLANHHINSRLARLRLKSISEITNLGEAKAELAGKLVPYLKYGRRAFEYYNSDHSAVIVYRISRRNLMGDIASLGVRLHYAGEAAEDKSNGKAR